MKNVSKTILVIDDDLGMIRLLEKVLEAQSYMVLGAVRGVLGLKLAKEKKVDLILLDVKLPDLTGAYVAKKLFNDPETKDIPIIFITVTISKKEDKADKSIEIDGRLYPAFAKPIYFPKMLSIIKKLLQEAQAKEGTSPDSS